MFNRKFSSNIRRKKRMIISTIILLVVCLGLGYAAFTTNLSINGTLNVSKYDQTLYGVLEKAAKKGTYAKEYTGDHQDSMAGVGTEKIYHWYAPSTTAGNTLANEIINKNNVIFANHCWQMIRTTDTGGVKMIYNGELENGQCLNTRGNHVGYNSSITTSMSTTYYYGTNYTFDSTNNVFSLTGTVSTGTIQTGQYTCKSTNSTGTCETLYLVDTLDNGTNYYAMKITSDSHYSQIGTLYLNRSYFSPSELGYVNNTGYQVKYKAQYYKIQDSNMTIYTSYYYSDTIDYGNLDAGKYTLTNPVLISTLSDYNTLVGKYILNTSGTSATTARYIVAVSGTTIYYKNLTGGDLNITLQVGDSYTDNGNGTYTIDNPTEITYIDWYNGSYSNALNKYVCNGTSATCTDLKHITNSTSKSNYFYWGVEHKYKYSESVSYSGGTYTLSGDIKEVWDVTSTAAQTVIATHHYSCLNTGTTCSTVDYINLYSGSNLYFIILSGEESIEIALENMLSANNVNQNDSTIKIGLDAWYKKYMTSYTDKLEDTIFCNDRSISNLGGWNPNGVNISTSLQFKNYNPNSDLSCTNITDKFCMANTKATLTYPVALLTYPEAYLLGNKNIRKSGEYYWLGSPKDYSALNGKAVDVRDTGFFDDGTTISALGVRPVISLKPGTEYVSGTGSMSDPYIVDTN